MLVRRTNLLKLAGIQDNTLIFILYTLSIEYFLISIIEQLKNDMVANREWLMEQTKYRSEENKRDIKRTYSDIFGMEGSFRQLSFD